MSWTDPEERGSAPAGRAHGRTPAGWDAAGALAVGGIAWLVYVSTLAPGLIGLIDAPKFQFIGKVLGVPHSPGYPLYVVVSHLFGYLPFGTLAFRINLMSAIFAAVTVSLVFLVLRRLGCRLVASAVTVLALALGPVFWSTAVVAEVYSLHAALVAGLVLALLIWRERRSGAAFFTAVTLFALALGNHTTVGLLAPALAAFVLMSDATWALRPRVVAASAVILTLGLAQYGFILLRTMQEAPYVESPASNIGELVDVMRGERWNAQLFEYDLPTLLTARFPAALEVFIDELTVAGLLFAAIGAIWLVCRRPPEATLLGLAALCVAVFAVNFRTGEPEVFLLPSLMCAWMAAGVGLERVLESLGRLGRLTPLTGVVLLVLPAAQGGRNWRASDLSREIDGIRVFDAIFAQLPANSAFVGEDFVVDRMVDYKVLGERAQGDRIVRGRIGRRDLDRIDRLFAGSVAVFAFPKRTTELRWEGFRFAEIPLFQPLAGFLADHPRGSAVAIAGPPEGHRENGLAARLRKAGLGDWPVADVPTSGAMLGLLGPPEAVIAGVAVRRPEVAVSAGQEIGSTGARSPAAIRARADRDAAWVAVNGQEVVRTREGLALAVVDQAGRLVDAHALAGDHGLRVPLDAGPLSLFRLMDTRACTSVPPGGRIDVSHLAASGKVIVKLSPGAVVVLYAGRTLPLDPLVTGTSAGVGLRVTEETYEATGDRAALEAMLAQDRLDATGLAGFAHVARVSLDARRSKPVDVAVGLALGGVPAEVWVADLSAPDVPVPSLCAGTPGLDGLFADETVRRERIDVAAEGELFAHGWVAAGRSTEGPARAMNGPEAEILLPLWRAGPARIRIDAQPLASSVASGTLGLRVNGTVLPALPIEPGWTTYEWSLPAGALREGTNQIFLVASPGVSGLAAGAAAPEAAVRSITLDLVARPAGAAVSR